MDTLRGEPDDYAAAFRRFRVGEASRLGGAPDDMEFARRQWYDERQQELRLEQQLRRVRVSDYGHAVATAPDFRIR
jgi:hypothetical protein